MMFGLYSTNQYVEAMKSIQMIALVGFITFAISMNHAIAQVVVKVKPIPPKIKMLAPKKPGSSYVLVPGHWIWHHATKMYAWVGPSWVPKKENKVWQPGHWKKVQKGWKWIPGHWGKSFRKQYFIK